MTDRELDELIDRYLCDDLTETQKGSLTDWLDASQENQHRFVAAIEKCNTLAGVLSMSRESNLEKSRLIRLIRKEQVKLAAIAAAIVALVCASIFYRLPPVESENVAYIISSQSAQWAKIK